MMKQKFSISIVILFLVTIFLQKDLKAEQMTINFPVLGNCYLCKLRIEEAVNRLDGIDTVNWDYDTKITTVTYNDAVVDAYIMMHIIASVGHDTEWFPANDSAYNALIGTCCEYERTNDYTNVEIGYLSLMDLWVFPVGIYEPLQNYDLKIYPTAGNGLFNFELDMQAPLSKPEITIYSMNGTKVYSQRIQDGSHGRIDLQFLSRGQYVLILTDSKKLITRSKLIKL